MSADPPVRGVARIHSHHPEGGRRDRGGSVVDTYQESNVERDITEADAISLPEACALAGAEPDFIKMDVEGAEVEIVQGQKNG